MFSFVTDALIAGAKLFGLLYATPVIFGFTGMAVTHVFPHLLDPLVRGRGLPMDSLRKDKMGNNSNVLPSSMAVVEGGLFGFFAVCGMALTAFTTGSWKMTAAYITLLMAQRSYFHIFHFLDNFLGLVPYSYAKIHAKETKTQWKGVPRYHILGSALSWVPGIDAKSAVTKHLMKITKDRKIHSEFGRLRSLDAGDMIAEIVDCYDFKWIRSFWQGAFVLEITLLLMPFSAIYTKIGFVALTKVLGGEAMAEIIAEIALLAGTDNITMLFDICKLEDTGFFTTTSDHGFVIKRDGVVYDSRHTSIFGNSMTHCPARAFVMDLWKSQPKFKGQLDAKDAMVAKEKIEQLRSQCPFARFMGASKEERLDTLKRPSIRSRNSIRLAMTS